MSDYPFEVKTAEKEGRALSVIDLSLGGVGLYLDEALEGHSVGDEVTLTITVAQLPAFEAKVHIRYIARGEHGSCGAEFSELSDKDRVSIQRYVGELLARGQSV